MDKNLRNLFEARKEVKLSRLSDEDLRRFRNLCEGDSLTAEAEIRARKENGLHG